MTSFVAISMVAIATTTIVAAAIAIATEGAVVGVEAARVLTCSRYKESNG